MPKFLTARCVMLANITAFGRAASGFLTCLRLDESADAGRKGGTVSAFSTRKAGVDTTTNSC